MVLGLRVVNGQSDGTGHPQWKIIQIITSMRNPTKKIKKLNKNFLGEKLFCGKPKYMP